MTGNSYLLRLTMKLALGLSAWDTKKKDKHAQWIRSQQKEDGGFGGREGGSDLYYTSFALRGLAIMGRLDPAIAEDASRFLQSQLLGKATIVDFYSLLYSVMLIQLAGATNPLAQAPPGWEEKVVDLISSLRAPDGGYSIQPGAPSGSTYQTFLALLAHEVMARPVRDAHLLEPFTLGRLRPDGGFVEVAPARKGGTNPTAAAIGILRQTAPGALTEELREGVVDFLVENLGPDGGIRANGRVPLSDLLSTFTGAWTLEELSSLDSLEKETLVGFLDAVEQDNGGFLAGVWDEAVDVEYTFYGLALRSLTLQLPS